MTFPADPNHPIPDTPEPPVEPPVEPGDPPIEEPRRTPPMTALRPRRAIVLH
ncbi:MAG: hypothetical protein AB7G05_03515 [Hyphomonadaceae bacterium]